MKFGRNTVSASQTLIESAHSGLRGAAKRAVLTQALQCFNDKGIEASTIDDLRRRSGQSVGAIYHHFGNKEGVAAALFFLGFDDQSEAIAAALARADGAPRQMIAALIGAWLDWTERMPEMALYLILAREAVDKGAHAQQLTERLRARYGPLDDLLAQAMRRGEMRQVPDDLIPPLILGPAESYSRGWLSGRRQMPPSQCAQVLAEADWRSLVA